MATRIQSNSASLKQRFKEIYEDFFARCFLVVSSQANFWITGEHAVAYGSFSAKQNLPLRLYCGLSRSSGKFTLNRQMMVYLPSKQNFHTLPVSDVLADSVEKQFRVLFKERFGQDLSGLTLHLLSETPPSCGLGTSGAFAAATCVVLMLYFGIVKSEEIASWSLYDINDEKFDKKSFDQVFRIAWFLESLVHEGISSGGSPFASLLGSFLPVIYVINQSDPPKKLPEFFSSPYMGFKLASLASELTISRDWPISFSLIYTGSQVPAGPTIRSTRWLRKSITEMFEFYQERSTLPAIAAIKNNNLFQRSSEEVWRNFNFTLSTVSLDSIWLLTQLFEQGGQKEIVNRFFDNINFYQQALNFLGVSTQIMNKLVSVLIFGQNQFNAALKLTGAGRGGDMVLYTPPSMMDKVADILHAFNLNNNEDIVIDYSSEMDGMDDRGLVIEQNLEAGIYADVISPNAVSVKVLEKDSMVTKVLEPDEISMIRKKIDLAVDNINHDIYIRGKKLTSKEIKSGKTSCSILSLLLHDLGQPVSNMVFPASSYAADRNELQSKIISPLNKTLKKITGRQLQIEVKGRFNKYQVSLIPNSLSIAVINQLGK